MLKSLRSPQHIALQQALKQARANAGLSQQQLANKLKRPQSFVAKYEVGERRLDVIEFLWICEALKCKPLSIIKSLQIETL